MNHATLSFAICRMQCTPFVKSGKTMEPYLRTSGKGLTFIITSVTTPNVPESHGGGKNVHLMV